MKIRYYGSAHLPTGYGRAALELILALDRAETACPGVELEVRTIGPHDPEIDWPIPGDLLQPIAEPDVAIIHTLPGDCHRVVELEGLRSPGGPKLVAYTTWEALTAPRSVLDPLFATFDQVWVPSQPNLMAFSGRGGGQGGTDDTDRRLHVIPHTFDERAARTRVGPTDSERFRFYYVGAWTVRKNPGSLIRAFANAFPAGSRAELVIHSPGCSLDAFVAALAATGLRQNELPTITLSNQRLSDESLAKLHADADCFVTASRGEAWNLPAFDAMLAGRHVITQYGLGSDEFLSGTSADLIDGYESPAQTDVTYGSSDGVTMTVKRLGAQGMTSRSLWLEPNLSSLADAMRSAFESRKRDIQLHYDPAERFGYAAVAKQVLNVLEQP